MNEMTSTLVRSAGAMELTGGCAEGSPGSPFIIELAAVKSPPDGLSLKRSDNFLDEIRRGKLSLFAYAANKSSSC